MNHLTDDQLSARLDDALSERERVRADAHLVGCDACRARLAEYAAMDTSLARALAPDPGEAYFADFAERVSARIAAGSDGAASPAPAAPVAVPARTAAAPQRRSVWAWLFSGQGISFAASTAALVLVAGLAWMRFHRQDDVASALREQVPSEVLPEGAVPAPDSLLQVAPPLANQATPSPLADAAPPAGASRAREVVTTPSGEEAPAPTRATTPPAAGTRLQQRDAAAPPSPVAEMKRRALVPAREKPEARQESARNEAGSGAATRAAPPPAAALTAPAPASAKMANEELQAAAEVARCGTLLDTRGQPIAGAQVVALGGETRTGTSGADGRFCLPSLRVGDTLSVWRVGYEPLRVVVGPATSLALRMESISTVGTDAGRMALGKAQESTARSFDEGRSRFSIGGPNSTAPAADVYATQPATIRLAVNDARIATERARRERTAQSHERAAERWERIGALTTGQATYDARFQALAALREANRLQPSADRVNRLRSRLATFLALVPKTLPEHDTALRWQAELETRRGPAYR